MDKSGLPRDSIRRRRCANQVTTASPSEKAVPEHPSHALLTGWMMGSHFGEPELVTLAEERGFNHCHRLLSPIRSAIRLRMENYDKPFPKDLDGPPGGKSSSAEAGNSSGRKAERDLGKKRWSQRMKLSMANTPKSDGPLTGANGTGNGAVRAERFHMVSGLGGLGREG
ncbi:hypothetical protein N5P37_008095 [Trichoderma harzianum]|uniref:Uncharacterized protein n=1 Tax=Trichoderma harzianum CBS 226.95 TaxID=983964 RepID=A0A2T4A273_TRIHA|nr:hypothetical protein M431DRAFT_8407 [Trichoderma harzianum CBS 226.95]KAK0759213.1 hypothetical protein N5P37_008095 [Trichoderma harzianum]PKK54243.1 hypothetical protein CI102_581 [Trichoderma harzianum]PTB51160.1 hypothetical protein M431DRAFT_8407 [Trichoderma harzianum CBS 226.95]